VNQDYRLTHENGIKIRQEWLTKPITAGEITEGRDIYKSDKKLDIYKSQGSDGQKVAMAKRSAATSKDSTASPAPKGYHVWGHRTQGLALGCHILPRWGIKVGGTNTMKEKKAILGGRPKKKVEVNRTQSRTFFIKVLSLYFVEQNR
jgi:hypothetical protein